jgi:hypothetical protein
VATEAEAVHILVETAVLVAVPLEQMVITTVVLLQQHKVLMVVAH